MGSLADPNGARRIDFVLRNGAEEKPKVNPYFDHNLLPNAKKIRKILAIPHDEMGDSFIGAAAC